MLAGSDDRPLVILDWDLGALSLSASPNNEETRGWFKALERAGNLWARRTGQATVHVDGVLKLTDLAVLRPAIADVRDAASSSLRVPQSIEQLATFADAYAWDIHDVLGGQPVTDPSDAPDSAPAAPTKRSRTKAAIVGAVVAVAAVGAVALMRSES